MFSSSAITIDRCYDSVLALTYPQACAICSESVESRHDGVVCEACWASAKLFAEEDALCWKCGAATAATVRDDVRMIRCGRCAGHDFTAARACGLYAGVLRASVLGLKRVPHVSRRLLRAVTCAQRRAPISEANLIIPVPLHWKRERERGYNQAAILARALAHVTRVDFDEHILVRILHTERHRAGLDARARRESVRGAFEVRASKQICGRRVLLIDDVFTTGATVSECASVLKAAGAEDVFVLTIARA